MKQRSKINIAAWLIMLMGLSRMIGEWVSSDALKGLGALTGFAPYPKVFCSVDGYEAFSGTFSLVGKKSCGEKFTRIIDAQRYSGLRGPYNRRNAIGAAIVFAPRLPDDLRKEMHRWMLDPINGLHQELDLPDDMEEVALHIESGGNTWIYQIIATP